MRARVIFVTGTDTGVGKTLLTGLLLRHLRASGLHALAMKPFCSGRRADVRFLSLLQDRELTLDEINPFFYPEPVAPLVSARKHRREVALSTVVESIAALSRRCEILLVEGAGGLLVPLGSRFTVADLIERAADEVIVVAANRLGTINHTLLTVRALRMPGLRPLPIKVVLMQHRLRDASVSSNETILREMLAPVPIWGLAFLGKNPGRLPTLKNLSRKLKKVLAELASAL